MHEHDPLAAAIDIGADRSRAFDVTAPPTAKAAPGAYAVLCGAVLLLTVGLLVYSQTWSFAIDEGFHLLAAQLIGEGKRPYLDFFFPQTPLNAYWNAAWMHLFGESWRVTHVVASFAVGGAVMLTGDYVYRRFPDPAWRLAAALTAVLCFGLNEVVLTFGTVAQAYGLCLLLIVCAFRCTVAAAERASWRSSWPWAAGAGLFASAAAASSLLTAPIAPVLLIWLAWQAPAGRRLSHVLAFGAGAIVPLLPLLWLFAEGPQQVVFNILTYHTRYRQVGLSEVGAHNVEVYSAWIDSGHALLLGGLAAAALLLAGPAESCRDWRRQLVLCAALVGALIVHISTAMPTHQRYFVFVVPFLAILAPVGLHALTAAAKRPLVSVAVVGAFLALASAKSLFDQRDDYHWSDAESIAEKINEVTPPDGRLFAEETLYFLTRRAPVSGLEHADAFKLSLPAPMNELLHLMPKEEIARRIHAGEFATVEVCEDDPDHSFPADEVFAESSEFDDCTLYWRYAPGRPPRPAASGAK